MYSNWEKETKSLTQSTFKLKKESSSHVLIKTGISWCALNWSPVWTSYRINYPLSQIWKQKRFSIQILTSKAMEKWTQNEKMKLRVSPNVLANQKTSSLRLLIQIFNLIVGSKFIPSLDLILTTFSVAIEKADFKFRLYHQKQRQSRVKLWK